MEMLEHGFTDAFAILVGVIPTMIILDSLLEKSSGFIPLLTIKIGGPYLHGIADHSLDSSFKEYEFPGWSFHSRFDLP